MSLPDWSGEVARYMLEEGLRNTLKIGRASCRERVYSNV